MFVNLYQQSKCRKLIESELFDARGSVHRLANRRHACSGPWVKKRRRADDTAAVCAESAFACRKPYTAFAATANSALTSILVRVRGGFATTLRQAQLHLESAKCASGFQFKQGISNPRGRLSTVCACYLTFAQAGRGPRWEHSAMYLRLFLAPCIFFFVAIDVRAERPESPLLMPDGVAYVGVDYYPEHWPQESVGD